MTRKRRRRRTHNIKPENVVPLFGERNCGGSRWRNDLPARDARRRGEDEGDAADDDEGDAREDPAEVVPDGQQPVHCCALVCHAGLQHPLDTQERKDPKFCAERLRPTKRFVVHTHTGMTSARVCTRSGRERERVGGNACAGNKKKSEGGAESLHTSFGATQIAGVGVFLCFYERKMQEGKIINRRKKGGKSELHLQLLSHDLSFHLPSSFLSSLSHNNRDFSWDRGTRALVTWTPTD